MTRTELALLLFGYLQGLFVGAWLQRRIARVKWDNDSRTFKVVRKNDKNFFDNLLFEQEHRPRHG